MATKGFLVGDHSIRPRRPVRYVANKQASKTTKRKKKKPEWDSTVNDLNVHKATKEEQIKRHELHKSKNVAKVHNLQRQLNDRSLDSTTQTPDTTERRKLAIVQEVLYGHDKLQDVLSESDKAMSVVKDLFGDDPKKFMGFPNITAAPSNGLPGKENRFPVAEPPETPTHLSLLSDSVMRTPALNELSDNNKDDELSPGTPTGHETHQASSSFQPMLDLQRFQQYVAEEQSRYMDNPSQPLLNGRGPDHVAPQAHDPGHVALQGHGFDHMAVQGYSSDHVHVAPYGRGTDYVAVQGYGSDHVHVASYGRGTDHVAAHGSMTADSNKPQDNPDGYPSASQPYFHPQAAVPSTVGAQINDKGSGTFATGHSTDHIASLGSVASRADHASQPPSFLSQGSEEIIAGGPNFVKPVSTAESTASHSIPPNIRPSSRHLEVNEQRPKETKKGPATSHKPPLNSSTSGLRSLDDLKKMVEELENEIAVYESETGRPQTNVSTVPGSFSGYTASLITAVTKLMGYLKESEIQRRAEMIMREQVLQGFEEQRVLVDALTNDILHTQEQNMALQQELLEYKKTTDEQLQYLKRELFAVLKSHEYQVLSSSINTLYSLNPEALKQGAFDAPHPKEDENHNFEYLPGTQTSQGQSIAQYPNMHRTDTSSQQASQGRNQAMHSDTTREPSFIPLATSQRVNTSLQQVNPSQNQPVDSYHPVQSNVQSSTGNDNGQQHFVLAPVAASDRQLPQTGHLPFRYDDSGSPSVANYGMTGHKQIRSNILMYPPSQGPFTQERNREETAAMPLMSTAGVPGNKPSVSLVRHESLQPSSMVGHLATSTAPSVRSEPTSLSSIVGYAASSTATAVRNEPIQLSGVVRDPATSADPPERNVSTSLSSIVGYPATLAAPLMHSRLQPGQSVDNVEMQIHSSQPVFSTMGPISSISQGVSAHAHAGPKVTSETMSRAAPPEPRGTREVGSVRHGKTFDVIQQQQQQPQPQQVHAEPSAKLEHALKPRGFVPVSRTMTSGLPAGHQLRERLQNLANRQKSLVDKSSDQNVGSMSSIPQDRGEIKEVQQPRPTSLHVHFKDPPVAVNRHETAKEQPKHSPSVSPIPHKTAAVLGSIVPPDKRVVVNLPNAWSDVSSTISL